MKLRAWPAVLMVCGLLFARAQEGPSPGDMLARVVQVGVATQSCDLWFRTVETVGHASQITHLLYDRPTNAYRQEIFLLDPAAADKVTTIHTETVREGRRTVVSESPTPGSTVSVAPDLSIRKRGTLIGSARIAAEAAGIPIAFTDLFACPFAAEDIFAFMGEMGPRLEWKREAGEKRDLWVASCPGAVIEFDAKTARLHTARFFTGQKDAQALLKEVAVQEWKDVDGIALPSQFTIAYFSPKGAQTSLRRVTLLENRAAVNKDVMKAIVPPEIPPGYMVTDAITGSNYQASPFESIIHSGSDYVRQLDRAIEEAKSGKK